jgi:hypothetical protein
MTMKQDKREAATIVRGGEYMALYLDGSIGRPKIDMLPSGEWKITGAVTLSKLGRITRRYSLAEILADPSAVPWLHKNGKQKTFVEDLDHGTKRLWVSPQHYIY